MLNQTPTKQELDLLAHSLGVKLEASNKLVFSRNYFAHSLEYKDEDYWNLISLECKGLLYRYEKFGTTCFSVTQSGKIIFTDYFNKNYLK